MSGRGGYAPTDGLAYDPEDPSYWDEAALHRETARVFEVCHGCRMCFKYCDTFPKLFAIADREHDGDARALTGRETAAVFDDCFQCKLCEVSCPYTPRDAHPFELDFPKLAHRHKAQQTRARGLTVRERVLANPDALGMAARLGGGLANRLNRNSAHRLLLEKTLGIHRDKLLPTFAPRTFEAWATDAGLTKGGPGAEVVLFQTCYVENNEPEIGRDTVEVLRANGVDVRCVRGLGCCGMPAWECGDLRELRRRARRNLDVLVPHVEAGSTIVVLGPTCALMLRREYPTLVAARGSRARAEAGRRGPRSGRIPGLDPGTCRRAQRPACVAPRAGRVPPGLPSAGRRRSAFRRAICSAAAASPTSSRSANAAGTTAPTR